MHLLALDTTTRRLSAALAHDDQVIAETVGDATRSHAEQLPGLLLDLVADARLAITDVDVFAIASGPGAFTGLRIGIATEQGLALVHHKSVVPVGALEVLAQLIAADEPPGTVVGTWTDAHRRDVFAALYRVEPASPYTRSRLTELDPPVVDAPGAVLGRWRMHVPDLIVGDGAVAYAQAAGYTGRVVAPLPLAPALARLALDRASHGELVGPAGIRPLYVRRPDAELAREAR